ncbi:VWA domain-containing protein [Treponema phagedenis]|uniref:VWA domain-containing protein n=1 Tax=Treponema phagedenis TaxID=162 RepID=UPI0003013CE9|nr:VWA domain-containing protein [Treponema phagedenis]
MRQIRKLLSICVLFGVLFLPLTAQSRMVNQSADIVVVMDTSGTVLQYHDIINNRVLKEINDKFVRKGDTFHVLSFNAKPRYEVSQIINSEADMSRIVSRFMLLYQLGLNSDFLSALDYAKQYVNSLPQKKEKLLIIISDGIFNPPETSPYKNYNAEQIKTALAKNAAAIRQTGWKVYYVKLPFPSGVAIKDLDGNLYTGTMDNNGNITYPDGTKGKIKIDPSVTKKGETSGSQSIGGETGQQGKGSAAEQSGFSAGKTGQNQRAPSMSGGIDTDSRTELGQSSGTHFWGGTGTESSGSSDTLSKTQSLGNIGSNSARQSSGDSGYGSETQPFNDTHASPDTQSSGEGGLNSESGLNLDSGSEGISQSNSESSSDSQAAEGVETATDVSGEFTKAAGINPSKVNADGSVEFDDTQKALPQVIFPSTINATGKSFSLPLTIKNSASESVQLQLNAVIFDNGFDSEKILVKGKSVTIKVGEEVQIAPKIQLPKGYAKQGAYQINLRLEFAEGKRVHPQTASVNLQVLPSALEGLFGEHAILYLILLILLVLILLFLLIYFITRRTSHPVSRAISTAGKQSTEQEEKAHAVETMNSFTKEEKYYPHQLDEKPDTKTSLNSFGQSSFATATESRTAFTADTSRIASQQTADSQNRFAVLNSAGANFAQNRGNFAPANHSEKIEIKHNQSGMTEIFVFNQTRAIGKRNIHVMRPGSRLSVGGGKSDDFLIFLVPFPSKLAQVRYDGRDYHLAILKPQYFPYETSNMIHNCIGKSITAVSDMGYHVLFTFRQYEDPIVKLNKILKSIEYK